METRSERSSKRAISDSVTWTQKRQLSKKGLKRIAFGSKKGNIGNQVMKRIPRAVVTYYRGKLKNRLLKRSLLVPI